MADQMASRVDEVLISFTYPRRTLASQCNQKLDQLTRPSLIPGLESAFEQVAFSGIAMELERLTIDLGKLTPQDINPSLGDRIKALLVEALEKRIQESLGLDSTLPLSPGENKSTNLALLAIQSYLLKGYFPAWMDKSWNLFSILEELINFSADVFGDLLGNLIRTSEEVKKRIAFLDRDYFDRIIEVLVPEDAEWMLGYRDSYLSLHQGNSELPSSLENVKKALNLFILNFIALDSGPRFNRLAFSDHFLKSIASHFNLEFDVFLSQIAQIANELPTKNNLGQQFKETILWVEERNTTKQTISVAEPAIGFEEFVHWLNFSSKDPRIISWIELNANSAPLFMSLARLFPRFWDKLNRAGFQNLIRLLAGEDADLWEKLAVEVKKIVPDFSNQSENYPTQYQLKSIFELAHEQASFDGLILFDSQDWYEILVLYQVKNMESSWPGSFLQLREKLVKVGLDLGISEAPLIWRKVVGKAARRSSFLAQKVTEFNPKEKEGEWVETRNSSTPIPLDYTELILWEYLRTGVLRTSFSEVNQQDLTLILENIIKEKNKILTAWIKHPESRSNTKVAKRMWQMIRRINRDDLREYLKHFGGEQSVQFLAISGSLEEIFQLRGTGKKRLDRVLWISFVNELTTGLPDTPDSRSSLTRRFLQVSLGILNRNQDLGYQQKKIVNALQNRLDLQKHLLFHRILHPDSSPLWEALQKGFLLNPIRISIPQSLLSWSKIGKREGLDYKPKLFTNRIDAYEDLNALLKMEFLSILPIAGGKVSLEQVKREVDLILVQEISWLLGSNGKRLFSFPKRERKEWVNRMILGIQARPSLVKALLGKNLVGLSFILPELKAVLSEKDWKFFSAWISKNFSPLYFPFDTLKDEHGPKRKSDEGNDANQKTQVGTYEWTELLSQSRDLQSKSVSNKVKEAFFQNLRVEKELIEEWIVLFDLPDPVFSGRSEALEWKRLVMILAFQIGLKKNSSIEELRRQFWKNFIAHFSKSPVLSQTSIRDWEYLLEKKGLSDFGKRSLNRFLKLERFKADPIEKWGRDESESLVSSLIFLEKEGFLPWWSPGQSKSKLIGDLLFHLQHADPKKAAPFLLVFAHAGLDQLVSDLTKAELEQLFRAVSGNRYKKHLNEFIGLIRKELEVGHGISSDQLFESQFDSFKTQGLDTSRISMASSSELSQVIKKSIQHSSEVQLVRDWFAADPRIQKQLSELLNWSAEIDASEVSPAKWKSYLLTFGFEFYKRGKKNFTRDFLQEFLIFLTQVESQVNWKRVIDPLQDKKEFKERIKLGVQDGVTSNYPLSNQSDFSISQVLDTSRVGLISSLELSKEIKKSIHYSKESQLVRGWFAADPRIQRQLLELLNWSSWMYAGNLNPGKWKSYLLTFGFEFYLRGKKSFTRDFLKEFLVFLKRSVSQVKWKLVFHQLLGKKEFEDQQNKVYKKIILTIFPEAIPRVVEDGKPGDQVNVNNAGLILCWPFLSVLFSRLGLLEEGKIPEKNQSKAVYLLQYLVFGHAEFPEYDLVLNKILIGMKSGQHLEKSELSTSEMEMTESLLYGMRSNWEKMKNASIEAIRETFLQRAGVLEFGFDSFILKVPKTGVDVLLDSVSWNISMIKLPWMEKSLEVKWR
ncbi:contractile injection system tape measure protein [Algoriphagus sp.]|uniref:contractile injection system tape measure protein n=1 Tax=Algoriphagus sp. TaxID=1872435 RepID=UPI00261EEB62|nr:contractile injection system tape measure protein [Algoriphagus sp.]